MVINGSGRPTPLFFYILFDKAVFCKYYIPMKIQKIMDELLQSGLTEGCFPGAVAACGDRNGVWALSYVGKIADDGAPVNEETRYDMASLSKILGPTMVALKALEAGRITLYDRLSDFFADVPEDKRDISVFQLMTHTAGFVPDFLLEEEATAPADTLACILRHPLLCAPGQGPHYSCMGYIVLGKVLEKVYGMPLNALAQKLVFAPLGMACTGYCPTGENIAATEVDKTTGQAWCGVVHDENARFQEGVSGNAGVFSCIGDMIRFALMLSNGGASFLSPATLQKAITNYTPGCDVHRGLGFHLSGTPENFMGDLFPGGSFGHTGFTGTSLAIDPQTGFFVILLSNRVHPTRDNAKLFRFRRRFHNVLYAAYSQRQAVKSSTTY